MDIELCVRGLLSRAVPTRPCRRSLAALALCTSFCYLLFRISWREDMLMGPIQSAKRELLARNLDQSLDNTASLSTTVANVINILEAKLAIDLSPKLSEAELASWLQPHMPNLPILYWQENKNKMLKQNKTCAKFPSVYDLHFSNLYWQVMETSNGMFYLYGAYLDVRLKNRLGPTVRILGMINRLEPKVKTYCQLWFNTAKQPVFSKVLEYKYIWHKKWGNYKQGIFQPYLLACQLPRSHWDKVPASVSIVEKRCDQATINLRVIYNKPVNGKKDKFAVCVKGLDFPNDDLSVRLIEWIEVLTTLGANKIFLYQLKTHPNVTKVLEYYVTAGKVDLTHVSLPGFQPNIPVLRHAYLKNKLINKRQNELIPYNDCLYRNIYRYEYIALLDIDEVIIPIKHNNWGDMMTEVVATSLRIKNETRASYNFRNIYFMDEMLEAHKQGTFKDIPPYLHMLQHVYRSANYTKPRHYIKCFHNPEKVLILHNHFPLLCLGQVCTSHSVDTGLAHLQHYRADCVNDLKKACANDFKNSSVKDTAIWRWKNQVVSRTTEALLKMGFFKRHSNPRGSSLVSINR